MLLAYLGGGFYFPFFLCLGVFVYLGFGLLLFGWLVVVWSFLLFGIWFVCSFVLGGFAFFLLISLGSFCLFFCFVFGIVFVFFFAKEKIKSLSELRSKSQPTISILLHARAV